MEQTTTHKGPKQKTLEFLKAFARNYTPSAPPPQARLTTILNLSSLEANPLC